MWDYKEYRSVYSRTYPSKEFRKAVEIADRMVRKREETSEVMYYQKSSTNGEILKATEMDTRLKRPRETPT